MLLVTVSFCGGMISWVALSKPFGAKRSIGVAGFSKLVLPAATMFNGLSDRECKCSESSIEVSPTCALLRMAFVRRGRHPLRLRPVRKRSAQAGLPKDRSSIRFDLPGDVPADQSIFMGSRGKA